MFNFKEVIPSEVFIFRELKKCNPLLKFECTSIEFDAPEHMNIAADIMTIIAPDLCTAINLSLF